MSVRATILYVALLLVTPVWAREQTDVREKTDVIVMNNGDRVTGEIKGLDHGSLQVSLDYAIGTLSVDWSKVIRLESKQLFVVKTQDGSVYTGSVKMTETVSGRPMQIQEVNAPKKELAIEGSRVVNMTELSESFWHRLSGGVNTGVIYSKGNQSTQLSLGSDAEYVRERWSGSASFNTNLSASSGATPYTRNQLKLASLRLFPWNNYFYQFSGGFLQSTEQGIGLQTLLGAGVGRYLKNTNRAQISLAGGLAWQVTHYEQSTTPIGTQNVAAGLIEANVNLFKFDKTNLSATASFLPGLSEPGRVFFNTNAAYYIKLPANLKWNLSFYGSWDSRPPGGLKGSDYGSSSGLSWTFGLK